MSERHTEPAGAGPADPGPNQAASAAAQPGPDRGEQGSDLRGMLREILSASWVTVLLAIVAALVVSAVLVMYADPDVRSSAVYFFDRPGDTFSAAWSAIVDTYTALFRGAIFDYRAGSVSRALRPVTETFVAATPLIFAGLGLGVAFRAGMFNIGAQGQVLAGAAAAAYVGFALPMPPVVHLVAAVLAAAVIGGLWAGIAGFLKARTGANEVITTIMLNWISLWLVRYLLDQEYFAPGSNPIAPPVASNSAFPLLLGSGFNLHLGFLLALAAVAAVWWLMERSTIGFKFRAVGANMDAARTAGINVNLTFVMVMVSAGLLAGLAGASQILGPTRTLRETTAGNIGFDAITVALLGRSRPVGVLLASLLFGAMRAGLPLMQVNSHTPVDLILILQATIVLMIAAPPLVRSMFRLPQPQGENRRREGALV